MQIPLCWQIYFYGSEDFEIKADWSKKRLKNSGSSKLCHKALIAILMGLPDMLCQRTDTVVGDTFRH